MRVSFQDKQGLIKQTQEKAGWLSPKESQTDLGSAGDVIHPGDSPASDGQAQEDGKAEQLKTQVMS